MAESLFFYLVGGIIPKKQRESFRKLLLYSGISEDPQHWWGRSISLSAVSAAAIFAIVTYLLRLPQIYVYLSAPVGFAVSALLFYVVIYARVEERRKRVERILPDLLQMVSANIRSGLTPVVALRTSARPEFGILEEEIKYATTKSLGTENLTDALKEISRRIDSEVLERVVALFSASMKSGGKLARLLESTAEDIRKGQELKAELVTSTKMYVMFVLFVVTVGTPVLLAISLQFIDMVSALQASTNASSAGAAALGGLGVSINLSRSFLLQISYFILVANGLLSAVLVGVIQEGRPMSGLKYAPFVIAGSLGTFFVVQNYVLKSILSVA
ncbi:MAG: type II secretion system F family protein [archaeon]